MNPSLPTRDGHMLMVRIATGWNNCEYRSYQFVDPTGEDEDAVLAETADSWRRREGMQIAPTQTEQREMRAVVQKRLVPYLKIKA